MGRLRAHGVRHIFTLLQKRDDELVEPWETESSFILERDPSITRTWIDISDSPYESLLHTGLFPRITRDIRLSLLAKESVFIHWFDLPLTRTG